MEDTSQQLTIEQLTYICSPCLSWPIVLVKQNWAAWQTAIFSSCLFISTKWPMMPQGSPVLCRRRALYALVSSRKVIVWECCPVAMTIMTSVLTNGWRWKASQYAYLF